MFVYDDSYTLGRYHTRVTSFDIEEQDIIVGVVDIIKWPQLQVKIMVHKAYVNNFNILNVLNKYKRDILELLEYETGVCMPIKSEDIRDEIFGWQMDLELDYPY